MRLGIANGNTSLIVCPLKRDMFEILTDRQEKILGLVVRTYVETGQAVSSKGLVEQYDLDVSSATVRNELAALDEMGYLVQLHTSAGRIPTEVGYRYFVQKLLGEFRLPVHEEQMIRHQFHQARLDLDQWMKLAAAILARTSLGASFVTAPRPRSNRFKHLQLISTQRRLVLMIFYANLDWFPPGRLSTQFGQEILRPGYNQFTQLVTIDALLNGRFDIFIDALRHMVLPIVTLSYLSWALLLKVTRSSMLESLRQDYVMTARAKGLPEKTVISRHVRPNALIPVTTVSAGVLAGLLNGVVITETIFNYPGLGSAAAAAAVSLDVLTMLGFALFNGFLFVGIFLVVDVLYGLLDPRIRLG